MARIEIIFEDVGEDLEMKFNPDTPLNLDEVDDWTAAQSAAYMMFSYIAEKIDSRGMEAEFTYDEDENIEE